MSIDRNAKTSPQIEIERGVSQLKLNEPAYGKITLVIDLDTRVLYLCDGLHSRFLELFPKPTEDSSEAILNSVCEGTMENFPYKHESVLAIGVQNGCHVGGGAAYFDGQRLYINDFSSRFGPLTKRALDLCLNGCKFEVIYGSDVADGDEMFAEKKRGHLARALKE